MHIVDQSLVVILIWILLLLGHYMTAFFEFASRCKLQLTYNLLPSLSLVSYRHQSLCASSLIGHFLVSSNLYNCLQDVNIIDDGANLSDHLPAVLTVVFPGLDYNTRCINPVSAPSKAMLSLRWDKAVRLI